MRMIIALLFSTNICRIESKFGGKTHYQKRIHEPWFLKKYILLLVFFDLQSHISGQIIATSHDLTPNGSLVREIPLFQGNLGWWHARHRTGRWLSTVVKSRTWQPRIRTG